MSQSSLCRQRTGSSRNREQQEQAAATGKREASGETEELQQQLEESKDALAQEARTKQKSQLNVDDNDVKKGKEQRRETVTGNCDFK